MAGSATRLLEKKAWVRSGWLLWGWPRGSRVSVGRSGHACSRPSPGRTILIGWAGAAEVHAGRRWGVGCF
ncbi:hypothetical protein SASPL_115014 [Salvia splendens]|uniref:Uncharacterized protein n=1 Tax=Salvia splendens TaxID=180675 RepID=A0A8X8Y1P4_SALSN|nr:hypothetical protein SASPL_115014 [Salvia splendens]